ncbi:hypothetical protein [Noviherbaspirillum cavernae]|uniref:hypothetical protein n=1 Tax=Noviherbaspirillum cavernae TaxID=2320862 RepID=UPI0018F68417|nr:hypothetical protein [Noviherbaspirillum cavernae]
MKEKIAAAEMLNTPAMVVASRMDNSVELILCLGEYATGLQIKAQTRLFGKWRGHDPGVNERIESAKPGCAPVPASPAPKRKRPGQCRAAALFCRSG